MKIKNFLAMMMAACVMVMGAASCDDDDDDTDKVVAAADAMVGTYTGEYILTVMGSADTATVEMTINKVDDSTIQLVTPAAGSGSMALPSLSVNLPVAGVDGLYVAEAESVSGSIVVNDVEKAYTFSNIAVTVEDNKAGISYSLQYGKMPVAMNVTFVGSK